MTAAGADPTGKTDMNTAVQGVDGAVDGGVESEIRRL